MDRWEGAGDREVARPAQHDGVGEGRDAWERGGGGEEVTKVNRERGGGNCGAAK